jgi:hypothetical protein
MLETLQRDFRSPESVIRLWYEQVIPLTILDDDPHRTVDQGEAKWSERDPADWARPRSVDAGFGLFRLPAPNVPKCPCRKPRISLFPLGGKRGAIGVFLWRIPAAAR